MGWLDHEGELQDLRPTVATFTLIEGLSPTTLQADTADMADTANTADTAGLADMADMTCNPDTVDMTD